MREVSPRFRICSPGVAAPDARTIVIAPSSAFGDGEHESTRMCLQALGALAPPPPFSLLDVGSGSGILAIAAAKLGAVACGVEIDETANVAARHNASLNAVPARFGREWPSGAFDVVVANILCNVLLSLAPEIAERVARPGLLVLSGLVSTDVPAVVARYAALLHGSRPEVYERGVWRTLVWQLAR